MRMEKGPGENLSATIQVKLLPRSSKNQIAGKEGATYRIKVTAPPVDGKANRALIGFLAEVLGCSKEDVEIHSGKTARLKGLRIRGLTAEEISRRLDENCR